MPPGPGNAPATGPAWEAEPHLSPATPPRGGSSPAPSRPGRAAAPVFTPRFCRRGWRPARELLCLSPAVPGTGRGGSALFPTTSSRNGRAVPRQPRRREAGETSPRPPDKAGCPRLLSRLQGEDVASPGPPFASTSSRGLAAGPSSLFPQDRTALTGSEERRDVRRVLGRLLGPFPRAAAGRGGGGGGGSGAAHGCCCCCVCQRRWLHRARPAADPAAPSADPGFTSGRERPSGRQPERVRDAGRRRAAAASAGT